MAGKVYLIGGGPGDPGLLTLRGREALSRADVVVYDFLANEALLEHTREEAEIVFLGGRGGAATRAQEKINALMIARAREGKTVARLKGGDPFVFGRGGEEALALAEAGVRFEIIPGVTSAFGVPLYAGIPVTHRDLASSVFVVTGHESAGKDASGIDWASLAPDKGTLIFLMGTANLPAITKGLVANGRAPKTPAALIRWGTRAAQQTITAPLSEIADAAIGAGIKPPTILVVGEVVGLRDTLRWFERKPLFGKRVLVTRARSQAAALADLLKEDGAEVVSFPVIAFREPEDTGPLDEAIGAIGRYDGALFTSVNAVDRFFMRALDQGCDARALAGKIVCAIGAETASALRRYGVRADVVPERFVAEALAEALAARVDLAGKRFLLPRAREAREALPEALAAAGARCDVVEAYRTVPVEGGATRLAALLEGGEIDVLSFTSSSTVTNFLSLLPAGEAEDLIRGKVIACIGPITARTALDAGLKADIVAGTHTVAGLARAITSYFKGSRDGA